MLHFPGTHMGRYYYKTLYTTIELLLQKSAQQDLSWLEKQLTIIIAHNYKFVPPVEKTLNSLGFGNFVNVGSYVQNWSNILKPKLVLDSIDNVTTEFVMFLDAIDVCVVHLDGIIEKFKQAQCKVLFGAVAGHYPYQGKDQKWHNSIAQKFSQFTTQIGSVVGQLNSGQWMCKAKDVRPFLEETIKIEPHSKRQNSDQHLFKVMFKKHFPIVSLDFSASIFQVLTKDRKFPNKHLTLEVT